jgi:hypothetical protein
LKGGVAVSTDADDVKPSASGTSAAQPQREATEVEVEYVRRVYGSTREWYMVAETKAQLLLAVNGAFVTIIFGVLFSKNGDIRSGAGHFGLETWIFLSVSVLALVSAIACAALCLWSLHGNAAKELAHLGVDPGDPSSYRAEVLWYFGHLAHLQPDAAIEMLRRADRGFEMRALSYNAVDLASKVLRKHRWVNSGWALTALSLIALAAAGASFFVRAQF